MVTIYAADVSAFIDMPEEEFWKRCEAVSERRKEKIRRYRFRKDRALSLGAGLLLKQAFEEFHVRGGIELTEHGKPVLADGTVSDYPTFFFNLSHSGQMVICAVSDREIGCDVERVGILDRSLWKELAPDEREYVAGDEAADMESDPTACWNRFFEIWTKKESYLKAVGTGITVRLHNFSVFTQDEYSFLDLSEWCESWPGYRFACCVKGKSEKITKKIIKFF